MHGGVLMNAELVVGFPDDAISFGDTPAVAVVGGGRRPLQLGIAVQCVVVRMVGYR